jgi:glycolate oxidase
MSDAGALGRDLAGLVGADAVLADPRETEPYGRDFAGPRGIPGAVVRPRETADVAAVMGYSAAHGVPVAARGAGSGVSGGFVPSPESIVFDMRAMDRIVDVDVAGARAVVQAGVLNQALQDRLAPDGMCFSPDPASRRISSVGGNIAENAGGPTALRHGVTFHHVHALEVVLADGRTVQLTDEDDVDLLGVLIGSEGILGTVTRATVRLRPIAPAGWLGLAAFERLEDATQAVSAIIAAGLRPAAVELCDRRMVEVIEAWRPSGYPRDAAAIVFVELEGGPDEVGAQAAPVRELLGEWTPRLRVPETAAERGEMWRGRLGAAQAMAASAAHYYICDVTVPRQRIPGVVAGAHEIAARHGLDLLVTGHAGDGNFHPILLFEPEQRDAMEAAADEMVTLAVELGGTLTGEHGVGTDKLVHMRRRFGPAELAAFRAIKRAFDPAGLVNPGVLLPAVVAGDPELPTLERQVREALDGRAPAQADLDAAGAGGVEVDAENLTVTVGGGVPCAEARAAVARDGFAGPGLEDGGSVGAAVARSGHRGALRRGLLGIRSVLRDGPRVAFGSTVIKDVAGLDAKRLVAGTRGAVGTVESVVLRVRSARAPADDGW